MQVLMLTRRVDRDDWRAGFAHAWIERLAQHKRIDGLDVICLERGGYDLPPNVRVVSMGKERGYSRLQELMEFQRAIASFIRQADVLFGHMIPRYTLVAAPWALLYGVPMVQWYTHRQVTLELQLVHALVARVVTASPESFSLPSRKVIVLGHGIDTERFTPTDRLERDQRLIVAVGRLSPIKHYETLIGAIARLVSRPGYDDVRVIIAGGSTPHDGPAYAERLVKLARSQGVEGRITFLGPVSYRDIHTLYHRAALTVNLCPTGGADKAVLESMACGVPVVVHNRTFIPLLADDAELLWCQALDPALLAERLADLLSRPMEERMAIGARLRARMQPGHDLNGLIERLVAVLEEVVSRRRRVEK